MEYRARVFPQESYYIAFLNTRGIKVADKREHVLHYHGTNNKELNKLYKSDKPDVVIIHNNNFKFKKITYPYIIDIVNDDKSIYRQKKIYTNLKYYDVCKLYYRRLGLDREIITHEDEVKESISMTKYYSLFGRLKEFMMW